MEGNQTNSGIELWDKFPTWLQWLLYIPIVFAIPSILIFLLTLLGLFRGDFEGFLAYGQIALNSGLFVYMFAWLAINLAPKAKRITAWILYSLWSVFVVLAIARCFYLWFWTDSSVIKEDVFEFIQSLVWFCVGIPSLLYFGKKYSINPEPDNT